jgi:protein tyrosine phosphatase
MISAGIFQTATFIALDFILEKHSKVATTLDE